MEENSEQRKSVWIRIFALCTAVLLLILILFHSLNAAINTPTFHLDGAFQTASGLFRIDSGQAPGRDFFPYLGVGPLLMIYPIFKMSGATLFASVFSTRFLILILGWISVSILFKLISRPRASISALGAGAAAFIFPFFITSKLPFHNVFAFAFEPGNSLKPLRAAAPYLIALAMHHLLTTSRNGLHRDVLAGLAISLLLLWSNDFAFPTAGLFFALYAVHLYLRGNATWKARILVFSLTVISAWAVLLSVATGGHPIELLKYNFLDVTRDQWWYFGPYGPTTRVFEPVQLHRLISEENAFALLVLALTLILAFKTRRLEHTLLAWIGLSLFAGGGLASLGGHLGGYFGGFSYWGAMTALLALMKGVHVFFVSRFPSGSPSQIRLGTGLHGVILLSILAGAGYKWVDYQRNIYLARHDPGRFYVPEFESYLSTDWKDYIDQARSNKGSATTEDYWGLWSSLNKSFPPWPVDSVIHALGETRKIAKERLANSDLIISTRYSLSPEWQPWNFTQNFWFYEEILSRWQPFGVSPTTIVWRKTKAQRHYSNVACSVSKKGDSFTLNSAREGYYKVTLNYHHSGFGRYLLMVRNNISFGADAGGYASLPLQEPTAVIPVLLTREYENTLDAKVVGQRGVTFSMDSCIAEEISYENEDLMPKESSPNFLKDNWRIGLRR